MEQGPILIRTGFLPDDLPNIRYVNPGTAFRQLSVPYNNINPAPTQGRKTTSITPEEFPNL
ncbi:hypothetical protein [Sinomicrobium sp. M5D2P9]